MVPVARPRAHHAGGARVPRGARGRRVQHGRQQDRPGVGRTGDRRMAGRARKRGAGPDRGRRLRSAHGIRRRRRHARQARTAEVLSRQPRRMEGAAGLQGAARAAAQRSRQGHAQPAGGPVQVQEESAGNMIRDWLAAAAVVLAATASAQESKPIRIVVPVPAGGSLDTTARLITAHWQTRGTTALVDNKPGANTLIGADFVARAAPDGTTLLYTSTPIASAPSMQKTSFQPDSI